MAAHNHHIYTALLLPSTPLEVRGGSVTIDEGWSPYVQGRLTIPLPDDEVLEALDPRDGVRVSVTASHYVRAGNSETLQSTRTFNMLVRERVINHDDSTVDLQLSSDESLLQDLVRISDTADSSATAYQSSLRSIINNVVLGPIGASLESSPAVDAPFYVLTDASNLMPNPNFTLGVSTSPFASFAGTGGTATLSHPTTGGINNGPYMRATWTVAGSTRGSLREDFTGPQLNKSYTASGWVRTNAARTFRLRLAWVTDGVAVYKDVFSAPVNLAANTWTKITATGTNDTATAGATLAVLFETEGNMPAGATLDMDQVRLSETDTRTGADNTGYFDGDSADTSEYGYSWTGTANASSSTRTALIDRSPDLLLWEPGKSLWDFVEPLLTNAGFRLFCDETRKWRLIDRTYAVDGRVTVAQGFNVTSGRDTISVESGEWYSAVVIKYSWKSAEGESLEAYDYAGSGTKGLFVQYERPYPGPGAAAYILSRATGRGRVQDVTALSSYKATPGMEIVVSLPETIAQTGSVSAVTWNFAEDLMEVQSRGLIDTPASAWLFLDEGESWSDSAVGQTWIGEVV